MCVCCTFRFFTIRQKRIRGGSTYAKCNSGQRDPAIVSLPRLARPGDTIDSVQLLEGEREREGGSKGRVGRENQQDGVRKR